MTIEARGWKGIGQLFGGLSDKDCIKNRLKRLGIAVVYDGRTPVVPVKVAEEAINKAYKKAKSKQ
jgi:hypothetical protein